MAKYTLYAIVADAFGAEISFEAPEGIPYDEMAAAVNMMKLADLMVPEVFGYPRDSVRLVHPEEYAAFMEAQA